jgi:serine/threonine protein phosphatase PrpC
LRVMAGSARGTKHQFYGGENQDAFFISRTSSNSHLVIAVADGVSSATHSAYGSKMLTFLVARQVAEEIGSSHSTDGDIKGIIASAVSRASNRVQNWNVDELYAPSTPPGPDAHLEVSATFSIAVISTQPDARGARNVTLACVGDSPCYTLRGLDWTLQSTATKEGELLEHGTVALPVRVGQDPRLEWFSFELESSDVLVMMTDGIGTSLGSGTTPVGKWLAPRIYGPSLSQDFAGLLSTNFSETLTYDRQSEDDDRAMVIVYDYPGIEKVLHDARDSLTPTLKD